MHIDRLLMRASPFRRHTKARCRRALRGPTRLGTGPAKSIGRQSGLLQKDREGRDGAAHSTDTTKPAVGGPSAARTNEATPGQSPPQPKSAGGAASYRKAGAKPPTTTRCRRALRGPTERNHPNPNRPAERPTENPNNHPTRIGRQSGLVCSLWQAEDRPVGVEGPSGHLTSRYRL